MKTKTPTLNEQSDECGNKSTKLTEKRGMAEKIQRTHTKPIHSHRMHYLSNVVYGWSL